MLVYCPRHRIGFDDELDPTCPQGAVTQQACPDPWPVDDSPRIAQPDGTVIQNPAYGFPIVPAGTPRPANLRSVKGR